MLRDGRCLPGRKSAAACALIAAVAVMLAGVVCAEQQREIAGLHYIANKPNTEWVPDPDLVDWDNMKDRPGYRYRGMAPVQQRFHDYIQQKRENGRELSWADRWMISNLQSIRRWPEAPVPSETQKAFMRHLRSLDRKELTWGERAMVGGLISRGLWPGDAAKDPMMERWAEMLEKTGANRPKNWFEETVGPVGKWMEHVVARTGRPMTKGAAPGNVYPGEPFNGMQIRYNVSGATLGPPSDKHGFTCVRTLEGELAASGKLTLSGTASQGNGYGARLTVTLWTPAGEKKHTAYIKNPGGDAVGTDTFSLSVDIATGDLRTYSEHARFAIKMDGEYSMGGGHRGLYVYGSLQQSAAQQQANVAAADAKWRKEVEETLKRLGYSNTPEGEALEEMREALKLGDAGWKAHVDKTLERMGQDESPLGKEFADLQGALAADDDGWDAWARKHGGGPPEPDLGGLLVGTGTDAGEVTGGAGSFTSVPRLSTAMKYEGVPNDSLCEAVWSRNGKELVRSKRQIGGNGWVSFDVIAGGDSLSPGRYTVTVTIGGKVVGRKNFVVR